MFTVSSRPHGRSDFATIANFARKNTFPKRQGALRSGGATIASPIPRASGYKGFHAGAGGAGGPDIHTEGNENRGVGGVLISCIAVVVLLLALDCEGN